MAPLMMQHAYTNYGGGGSGNLQQMQLHAQQQQQLHLQQQQMQQVWNSHAVATKRSKYYFCQNKKKQRVSSGKPR